MVLYNTLTPGNRNSITGQLNWWRRRVFHSRVFWFIAPSMPICFDVDDFHATWRIWPEIHLGPVWSLWASIAPKRCRDVYLSPPKKKKDAIGNSASNDGTGGSVRLRRDVLLVCLNAQLKVDSWTGRHMAKTFFFFWHIFLFLWYNN